SHLLHLLAGRAPASRALAIDREPERHARQPGAEPVAIAELMKAAVGLRERLLRDVLRVLPVAQHAVGDAEGEGRRLHEARLELPLELVVNAHERGRRPRMCPSGMESNA